MGGTFLFFSFQRYDIALVIKLIWDFREGTIRVDFYLGKVCKKINNKREESFE